MTFGMLTGLRLTAFKSFSGAVLPLGDTKILMGRNSSGKSNALDALDVLARLAEGEDLVDALDARNRASGAVRGGSLGLPPHGSDEFSIGCTVSYGREHFRYDVSVQTRPHLRVVQERLLGPGQTVKSGKWEPRAELFEALGAKAQDVRLSAQVYNGRQGANPTEVFRDGRTILSQLEGSRTGKDRAERSVLRGVQIVRSTLRGIFHLDPVPHLMRDYENSRDAVLRSTGQNLAPVLRRLKDEDRDSFKRVVDLVKAVADSGVDDLGFVQTELGEIMIVLKERRGGGQVETTTAREMSDGLLRITAIATALVMKHQGLDVRTDSSVPSTASSDEPIRGAVTIVIEELENGLHPSQAKRVLELVREAGARDETDVLITTHSPALLDAAQGSLNDEVMVALRDQQSGNSRIEAMVDLPGYIEALGEGSLGSAVTHGKLVDNDPGVEPDFNQFDKLLGIA